MDLNDQAAIQRLADQYGRDALVVLLGSPDPDSAQVASETVTTGDPTYAGPLAGVSLRLPVYHVLEAPVRAQIPADLYGQHVGLMETVLDGDAIAERIRGVRRAAGMDD